MDKKKVDKHKADTLGRVDKDKMDKVDKDKVVRMNIEQGGQDGGFNSISWTYLELRSSLG